MVSDNTKELKKRKWDLIFILIAAALAAVLYFSGLLAPGGKGAYAVIYFDGTEMERIKLDNNYTELPVRTHLGENIVAVSNEEVSVISADCPDKLCVKQGKVSKKGETIVCLPHKIVVEVEGGISADYDIISK